MGVIATSYSAHTVSQDLAQWVGAQNVTVTNSYNPLSFIETDDCDYYYILHFAPNLLMTFPHIGGFAALLWFLCIFEA